MTWLPFSNELSVCGETRQSSVTGNANNTVRDDRAELPTMEECMSVGSANRFFTPLLRELLTMPEQVRDNVEQFARTASVQRKHSKDDPRQTVTKMMRAPPVWVWSGVDRCLGLERCGPLSRISWSNNARICSE